MLGQRGHRLALPVGRRAHVKDDSFRPDALDDARLPRADHAVGDALDHLGHCQAAPQVQPGCPAHLEVVDVLGRRVDADLVRDALERRLRLHHSDRVVEIADVVGLGRAVVRRRHPGRAAEVPQLGGGRHAHGTVELAVQLRLAPRHKVQQEENCHTVGDSNSLILARQLTKRFGDLTAVDGIDFEVAKGEAFGFLGPNGAGKTSTMRMIGGVSPVTSGLLTIFGLDPARHGPTVRARLGVVPQADTLDLELTVRENLMIYSRYFDLSWREGARRADELLEFVQLKERSRDKVDELSAGMKQRLTIARAPLNSPASLLLDEPTTGLDPQARHLVWDRLYQLKQRGLTLVLTTHYMEEA